MIKALLARVIGMVPVIILVSAGIFGLINLAPGDAASILLPEEATEEQVAQVRAEWGLDQPLYARFATFMVKVANFDLGYSLRYQDEVINLIAQRLPATLELAMVSLLIAVVIGVPMGIIAALNKGKPADSLVSVVAIAGVSAPSFWIGILLVLWFSGTMNLLPSSGRIPYGLPVVPVTGFHIIDTLLAGDFQSLGTVLRHLALPAITLAAGMVGIIARITRSALIDVGQEDFIFTAVAKGLSRRAIVRGHLLPNAAIPITTIVGLELGSLISGSIIVEVIFSWPGVGTLLYQGVTVRDTQLTTGVVIIYTFIFIVLNMLIDLIYVAVDPRMRSAGAGGRK